LWAWPESSVTFVWGYGERDKEVGLVATDALGGRGGKNYSGGITS